MPNITAMVAEIATSDERRRLLANPAFLGLCEAWERDGEFPAIFPDLMCEIFCGSEDTELAYKYTKALEWAASRPRMLRYNPITETAGFNFDNFGPFWLLSRGRKVWRWVDEEGYASSVPCPDVYRQDFASFREAIAYFITTFDLYKWS